MTPRTATAPRNAHVQATAARGARGKTTAARNTCIRPNPRRATDWDWSKVSALCLRETRRLLGSSSAAADDAAQEATIRAWKHRGRCRTPARPEAWIATIARREALRALARPPEQPVVDDEQIADPRQETVDVLRTLDIRRALKVLDGQDRQLLIGHYWQDLPNSELALQLGLAEVTVRVRLHRIRERLRETLKEL